MSSPWWRKLFYPENSDTSRRKRPVRRRNAILWFETLEDRVVPSNWTVTNASSSGAGSLAAAVASADTDTSPAIINFAPADFASATTITLTAPLSLSNASEPITIDGTGAGPITVSGGSSVQDFVISGGVATIENLTISNGNANTNHGGGIDITGGTATIENCTVSNNTASSGGGLYISNTSALILLNDQIAANSGNGIYNLGSLTVLNCTLTGNQGSYGGGIDNKGSAFLLNSTIANNYGLGGSGASSTNGGGGIGMNGGTLSLTNCTVTGNSVASEFTGGGIFLNSNSASVTILNSIVADNLASGGGPDINIWEGILQCSYSLIGSDSGSGLGGGPSNGNLLNVASDLGPLAENGGVGAPINPPETAALQSGSPALGAGTFVTSLSSAIASTAATSITVADDVFALSALPALSSGSYFTIQIDGEQMAVTAVTPGTGNTATLTVERGADSTTAATHAANASVYLVSDERSEFAPYASSAVVNMGAFQGLVSAPSLVVTNTSASASVVNSLPWCVAQADAYTSPAVITFDPADFASATTITLTAPLTLNNTSEPITIDGSGAGPITVSGAGSVQDCVIEANVTATILNLTISDGSASGNGGAINNAGTMTLLNDVVSGSTTNGYGGGVYSSGMATLANDTLNQNYATGGALQGGAGAYNAGTMTITDCMITANSTSWDGGGVNNAGTMTMTNCTISGNTSGYGAFQGHSSETTIIGCTFTGNTSQNFGGAVWLSSSGTSTNVTIINSTITGNSAPTGGGVATNDMSTLTLTLTNCTISGNTAGSTGGVYVWSPATVTLNNTIVAHNTAGGSESDISGTVSGINNLVGNGSGMSGLTNGASGNQVGSSSTLNPMLNSLANNGGATQTMSEQTGSPAIGAASFLGQASAVTTTSTSSITVSDASAFASSPLPILSQITFTARPNNSTPGSDLNSVAVQDLNSSAYYYVQIDGEEMAVIGLTLNTGNTATLDVIRDVNGTMAATHAANADVYIVSDQRGEVTSFNNPAVVDIGAYQSTASSPAALDSSPVVGATIMLALPSGTLGGTTAATTNASGVATFSNLTVATAGTYSLTATSSSDATTSNSFVIASGGLVVMNTSASASVANSLPWCVAQADAYTSSAVITFDPADFASATTIILTAPLTLSNTSEPITIDATGVGPITVSGGGAVEDFSVASGVTAVMDGLAITDGKTGGNGAGIENHGTLTVSNCDISNDTSTGTGGGINNETTGVLTVTDCTVSGNSATGGGFPTGSGGGIFNYGTAVVDSSTLSGNTCGNFGAALAAANATTTVTNCLVTGNSSPQTSGGFNIIYGSLTIDDCTFSDNTAAEGGAAITNNSTATITNSTFANNVGGSGWGGAIAYDEATSQNPMVLVNCTVSNNTAVGGHGGGIYDNTGDSGLTLVNCIVAGNTAATDPDIDAVAAGNNNLIGIGTGMTGLVNGANGNIVGSATGTSAILVPLGNYGGTLPTMPLFSTSPAIDTGGNVTTLTNAISAADTSIVVADAGTIASTTTPTVIQIGNEQMLVTAVDLSTNTLTVTRGYNGTTAAAQNATAGFVLPQDEIGQTRVSAGQSNMGAVATVATVTFTTQPANTSPGAAFSVAIHVSSSNGASMTGIPFSLGISSSLLSGTTTATTNSSGNATFSNLSIATPGTYTLTAQVNGGVTATSNSFTIVAALSTLSFSTEPPASIVAGSSFSPVVLAESGSGTPVANATLTVAISSGTLIGTATATTNSSGLATFSNLSVDIAGTYSLTASAGSVSGNSSSFTITPSAAATFAFLTQPTGTTAGSTINSVTVKASDSFGNLEGAGVSVTVALASGSLNGTLTGTTNGSGQVTFSNLSINAAGTYTLLASCTGATGATSNSFIITAGAGLFTFLTEPTSTTAGTILNPITVQVADGFSNPLAGVTVTIGAPPATLSGGTTVAVTNGAGQVVFSNLVEDLAETYSLTASATGLTNVSSNSFTITAATAAKLAYLSQPSSTTAGTILSSVTVQVTDKFGNAVTGSTIGIATTAGALSSGTTPLTSNALGQVVFSNLVEDIVGTYTLSASTAGVTSILSNPFTISAAGVATLAFVSQPTNATAGNTLSSVSVKALDPFGNVVPGASVSIGITPGTLASGTLTQTTGVTGLALFGNLIEYVTGTYSLIASATGATSAASNSFIITAAAAANLSFLSQPSSTTAGSVLNPVTVQVADKFGNAVPSTSIGVALSPGTLSTGTTPLVANALGQVVFGDLSEDKIGTYSLTASAATLSASSSQFTITPSLATAKLSFISQPNSTIAGTILHPITVQIADQYNNPISGVSIGVALSMGTLSAGTTPLVSSTAGQVVFNDLAEDTVGTYSLVASSASVASVTSGSFVITAAAAANLSFLSQPSSTTAGSILNSITVQVADKYGNAVSGTSVGIALTLGTLSTGTTPIVSGSTGESVFTNLSKDAVGTYTLMASSGGLSSVLSSPFTISPAAASVLSYVTQPSSTTAGNILKPVSVLVEDKYGNVEQGVSVGIATTSGSLSTGTTPIVTSGTGVAVFGDLTEDLVGTYTLAASATGVTSVRSNSFVITPAAASQLSFITEPSSSSVGTVLNTVTVLAADKYGNGIVSTPITLTMASGTLTGVTGVSANTSGRSIYNNLAVTTEGSFELTASAPGFTSVNSNPFTIAAGSAYSVSFVHQPTATAAGSVIGPVTVLVADKYGNGVPNASVGIGLVGNKLSTGTTPIITNGAGQAIFSDMTEDTAGTFTLSASVTGLTSATSSPFAITAAAPATITFVSQPTSGPVGSNLGPVTVNVADQFGNKVTTGSVSMSISSGSLSGATAATINSVGQAVFSGMSASSGGGGLTLIATDGAASASSNPFAESSSADVLQFTTEPSTVAAGSTLNAVTVSLTDPSGSPVSGITLTMGLSSGALGGTVMATSNSLGQATFSNLSVAVGGSFSLVASASGVASATSNSFTVTAPAAARLVFLTQPGTVTAGNTINTVTVEALDSLGSAAAGAPIVMSVSSGSLSGSTTVTTNASGLAVFTGLSTTMAGTETLLAVSGSVHTASNNFTVLGAAPVAVSFLSQPGTVIAGNAMNPITALVVDKYGNGVANVSVGLYIYTQSTVDGTTTLTTNSAGQAIFTSLRMDKTGVDNLTLQVSGLTKAVSNIFTVSPQMSSARLVFLSQPASATAKAALNNVTVEVIDQYGNLVPNETVSIRLSTGTLDGTLTGVTNSLGQVIFSKLSIPANGTGLALIASAPGLASVSSNAFNIS